MTLTRLGLDPNPIVFVNTRGFCDGLRDLQHTSRERMMDVAHAAMWQFVESVEDVLPEIRKQSAVACACPRVRGVAAGLS